MRITNTIVLGMLSLALGSGLQARHVELNTNIYSSNQPEKDTALRGSLAVKTSKHTSVGVESTYKKSHQEPENKSVDLMVKGSVHANGMHRKGLYASAGVGTQVHSGKQSSTGNYENMLVSTAVGYKLVDNVEGLGLSIAPEVRSEGAYNMETSKFTAFGKPQFGITAGIQI